MTPFLTDDDNNLRDMCLAQAWPTIFSIADSRREIHIAPNKRNTTNETGGLTRGPLKTNKQKGYPLMVPLVRRDTGELVYVGVPY